VSGCCPPEGYRRVFSETRAASEARRYRGKGLDPTSRRVLAVLTRKPVSGSLLEVGGGIGAIQLELLQTGARRAVNVELTPTYETAALTLLRESGLQDRVERRVADFVSLSDAIEKADVVIMNRVVCCYPDMPRLVGAAAERTEDRLVISYPRSRWWIRLGLALANLLLRLAQFRVFLHPPGEIRAVAEARGLTLRAVDSGFIWEIVCLERREKSSK
jgi:magnesium-protoporphyrin O-methyltransferase